MRGCFVKYMLIDTSSSHRFFSLIDNDKVVYYVDEENGNDLSVKLLTIIDEAFKNVDFELKDINKIFVGTGPGSFTGIRIGITVAKVIAWSLKIDIIPFSTLEMIASTNQSSEYIIPYIDARRDYLFAAIYDKNLNAIFKDSYIHQEELNKITSKYERKTFISYDEIISSTIIPQPDILKIVHKHMNDTPVNPHTVTPNYIKKTEAEEKLEAK